MEAHTHSMTQVFSDGGYIQYVLPHFQREYTWETSDWQTLLEDAYTIYNEYDYHEEENDRSRPEHFMGSLVRISNGARNGITTFTLVDGQQRLTTISLLLCVLCTMVRESDPALARNVARMLINPDEPNLARYKVLPTIKHDDRVTYIEIVDAVTKNANVDGSAFAHTDSNILPAYSVLYGDLAARMLDGTIEAKKLFATLMRCFAVVTIDLKLEEQPYKIFESLNAKGKALTPGDLVRNYIAMTLPDTMQDEVFEQHWSVIDDLLQEKRTVGSSPFGELTGFLRHYLAARTGNLYNREHIYARFRDRIRREFEEPSTFVAEIVTMRRFAEYYDRLLRPEHEPSQSIEQALERLQTFEMSTAFPFLLMAYDAYEAGKITNMQFADILKAVENYVVRRFLCGKQANYLNNMFPTLWDDIDFERFPDSLHELLATKQYPTDHDVRNAIRFAKMYTRNQERIALILDTVNRGLSQGSGAYTILDGAPTLEHILPQSLSDNWQHELGDEWAEVQREHLHTLGNLTLVTQTWNSSLSNAPFAVKKDRLAENGLRLNGDYFERPIAQWNKESILIRADWLADRVMETWPALDTPKVVYQGSGLKPVAVTVLGTRYPVSTWRDVMYRMAEIVAEWVGNDEFTAFAQRHPDVFSQQPFRHRPKQLPNGWWVFLNLSRANVLKCVRQILMSAGIPDSEWGLEEVG